MMVVEVTNANKLLTCQCCLLLVREMIHLVETGGEQKVTSFNG